MKNGVHGKAAKRRWQLPQPAPLTDLRRFSAWRKVWLAVYLFDFNLLKLRQYFGWLPEPDIWRRF